MIYKPTSCVDLEASMQCKWWRDFKNWIKLYWSVKLLFYGLFLVCQMWGLGSSVLSLRHLAETRNVLFEWTISV